MFGFGSFWPITTTVLMVIAIIIVVVTVAPVIWSLVIAVSWAMSARIFVEAHFGLFGVGILIDGCYHLADPPRRLAIELGTEVTMMESSNEGGDDLCFRDVGNIIPHLRKASDMASGRCGSDHAWCLGEYTWPCSCR